MAIINLSAPWITFYRKVEAMFKYDPDINVVFDAEHNNLKLFVFGTEKAEAIQKLLPPKKVFGEIEMFINVYPSNSEEKINNGRVRRYRPDQMGVFDAAFACNPAYCYETYASSELPFDIHYVVFAKRVVQYYNDNIGDVNGVCSTLYQDIAKDIFVTEPNVHFCTNIVDGSNRFPEDMTF